MLIVGILDTLILNPWRICTALIPMGSLCSSLLVYSIYSIRFPGNFILSDKADSRVIVLVAFPCQGGLSCSLVLITWDTVDLSITLGNVRMDFFPLFYSKSVTPMPYSNEMVLQSMSCSCHKLRNIATKPTQTEWDTHNCNCSPQLR